MYWNWFDFVIVVSSLLSLLLEGVPGLSVLRLLRAFRVVRLFKRIESLRAIIEGVLSALPGVTDAFVILLIFMGIWSIVGVEFFANVSRRTMSPHKPTPHRLELPHPLSRRALASSAPS